MKPLVCVFAHPDDEAFGPGGSIAKFAKEREVFIICVTDGSAGKSSHDHGGELGEVRREEMVASAKILGVKDIIFLNFKDGSLCNNLYHEVADQIQKHLEHYAPDTLLTFEERGVSGHIDHIAVSMITTFVFRRLPFVKQIYYYCGNRTAMDRQRDTYFIYMPSGYTRKTADLVIDTNETWEKKLTAMHQHKTQMHDIERILNNQKDLPHEEYFLVKNK